MPQILVLLDGSARAEVILLHVLILARVTTSDIILLRVITPLKKNRASPLLPDRQYADERILSQNYLTTVAHSLRAESVRIQTETLHGDAGATIVSFIQHHPDIQLIALTTRGQGIVGRWILGNVAEQVMHSIAKPLLLLTPSNELATLAVVTYRTIIVPVDGTVLDEKVLVYIKILSLSSQTRVVLVALPSLFNGDYPAEGVDAAEGEAAQQRAQKEKNIAQQAQRLRSLPGLLVEIVQAEDEVEVWIERLTQNKHDVLVITPYRRYSDHLAFQFLRHPNVPVLLIPRESRAAL